MHCVLAVQLERKQGDWRRITEWLTWGRCSQRNTNDAHESLHYCWWEVVMFFEMVNGMWGVYLSALMRWKNEIIARGKEYISSVTINDMLGVRMASWWRIWYLIAKNSLRAPDIIASQQEKILIMTEKNIVNIFVALCMYPRQGIILGVRVASPVKAKLR